MNIAAHLIGTVKGNFRHKNKKRRFTVNPKHSSLISESKIIENKILFVYYVFKYLLLSHTLPTKLQY